jgi:hypothetical protein
MASTKSATYAIGPERLRVDHVGEAYQLTRADGSVHGAYLREQDATNAVIRLSNQLRDEDEDAREAEELHEYDRDDAPQCRHHACCLRLRAETEPLSMRGRHAVASRADMSWVFEDGRG